MDELSHIDEKGLAVMVDVSEKKITRRTAIARSVVVLPPAVMEKLTSGDIQTKKGSVIQAAIIAGIMAAKKTSDLIPLCHPLGLDDCKINISISGNTLIIDCTTCITAKTGVEMEALVGASLAALTIYDMCKALSHDIVITETKLLAKTGGTHEFTRS